jgi:hypothetical protein
VRNSSSSITRSTIVHKGRLRCAFFGCRRTARVVSSATTGGVP